MQFHQFRVILTNLSIALDRQSRPSAHNSAKLTPLPDDLDGSPTTIAWWNARPKAAAAETPRTRAFMLAYISAVGPEISARGIELDDGWIWPDRDIMKAMLRSGVIEFRSGEVSSFVLTEHGRHFLLGEV
jgi:hypothetical protein